MSDEVVKNQGEKPKSQLDFAFEAINGALYYVTFQETLGLSKTDLNGYLHAAREDVLAVDVNSIDDEEALRQFVAGGNQLLEIIKKLNG